MKSTKTLVTVALFCLLVALTALPVLRFSFRVDEKMTSETSGMQDIRRSALQLHRCSKLKADKMSCEAEFSELASVLESQNRINLDFQKLGFLDVFIKEEVLMLRRRSCAADDLAGRVIGWSAWSKTEKPRTDADIKYGQYTKYHHFDVEGRRFATNCLLVIALPIRDLRRLYIALLNAEKTKQLWMIDHEW